MLKDVDGGWAETGMIGCQMAMICKGAMDAVTGNVRRPTVVSRNGGTSS